MSPNTDTSPCPPGHTNEHVCFLTSEGDLFTGDTILGFGTTAIFPPDGHMGDYLRSLHTLRERNPKRIYPAHGPIREDAVALIDEYIAHRLEREAQVLGAVESAGTTTIPTIVRQLYTGLIEELVPRAEQSVHAHLQKLAAEGKVRGEAADGDWSAAS